MDLTTFLLPASLMGVGIAIDVTIATVSKFRDRALSAKNWTLPITATHIAFPAIGYYLFWGIAEFFPHSRVILGLAGFVLVAVFVYEVVCESIGAIPAFGISAWIGETFGFEADDSRRLVAVLAVSWDALWSGPAKSAQAEAGNWSALEVSVSFLIAGVVVALIAQLALLAARVLRRLRFSSPTQLAIWFMWGRLIELSVIGGFGVLSLSEGLNFGWSLYHSMFVAFLVLMTTWLFFRQAIYVHELEEAEEAVYARY